MRPAVNYGRRGCNRGVAGRPSATNRHRTSNKWNAGRVSFDHAASLGTSDHQIVAMVALGADGWLIGAGLGRRTARRLVGLVAFCWMTTIRTTDGLNHGCLNALHFKILNFI